LNELAEAYDLFPVKFRTQPTSISCQHTCVAMLVGVAPAEILRRWPQQLSTTDVLKVLASYGYSTLYTPVEFAHMIPGVYLGTVGQTMEQCHAVVLVSGNPDIPGYEQLILHDPMEDAPQIEPEVVGVINVLKVLPPMQ